MLVILIILVLAIAIVLFLCYMHNRMNNVRLMKREHDFNLLLNAYHKIGLCIASCNTIAQLKCAENMVFNFNMVLCKVEHLNEYTKPVLSFCNRHGVHTHEDYIKEHHKYLEQLISLFSNKRDFIYANSK